MIQRGACYRFGTQSGRGYTFRVPDRYPPQQKTHMIKMAPKYVSLAGATLALAFLPASATTIAYYNFEEGTNGQEVNPTGANGAIGSITVAGGGDGTNGMVAWSLAASPNFTTAVVPVTPYANTTALSFAGGNDLYQPNSGASTLATTNFTNITIEAYVNFNNLGGWQTFVGRDDNGNPGSGAGATSLLYLAKSGNNNGFRVELINASNATVQVNSSFVPVVGTWYHVAAVGDATAGTLSLFVDGVSVGSATGYDGLLANAANSWTIGRGQYAGGAGDTTNGFIDEVRISDVALAPSQFLSAIPEPSTYAALAGAAVLGLALARRRQRA